MASNMMKTTLSTVAVLAMVATSRCVTGGGTGLLAAADSPHAVVFNVREYGAHGRARLVHDATVVSGSKKLASPKAHFTSADAGQPVYVVGAGPKGGPLSSIIAAAAGESVAELADAASTTVREASLTIGPDETEAVTRAIAAAAAAGGGTVYFPSGMYRTTKGLEITASNIHLQGEGDGSVIYNSLMQFYADSPYFERGKEHVRKGGWTGTRVISVGTPKRPISNIEIDHLHVMNNGDQWAHASIGQPILMTGATMDYVVTDFHLHHVTLSTKSYNGYSNGGVLDRFSIHHLVIPETAKEAIYLAGRSSNGTVSDNRLSTTINPAISNIGIAGKNLRNVKILRNMIAGKFWCGIGLFRFPEEDVLIEGNVCSFTPHPHAANGICADRGARITVARNTVENAGTGIGFRGSDTALCEIVIRENTVRNTPRGYAILVVGGDEPTRGPRNVAVVGNTLLNNANGIDAWNVTGNSRIAGNRIQADKNTGGTAFHVQPAPGATLNDSANTISNYRPGILKASGL